MLQLLEQLIIWPTLSLAFTFGMTPTLGAIPILILALGAALCLFFPGLWDGVLIGGPVVFIVVALLGIAGAIVNLTPVVNTVVFSVAIPWLTVIWRGYRFLAGDWFDFMWWGILFIDCMIPYALLAIATPIIGPSLGITIISPVAALAALSMPRWLLTTLSPLVIMSLLLSFIPCVGPYMGGAMCLPLIFLIGLLGGAVAFFADIYLGVFALLAIPMGLVTSLPIVLFPTISAGIALIVAIAGSVVAMVISAVIAAIILAILALIASVIFFIFTFLPTTYFPTTFLPTTFFPTTFLPSTFTPIMLTLGSILGITSSSLLSTTLLPTYTIAIIFIVIFGALGQSGESVYGSVNYGDSSTAQPYT